MNHKHNRILINILKILKNNYDLTNFYNYLSISDYDNVYDI